MAQSFSTSLTPYSGNDAVRVTFDSPLPSGFSLNGGRITTGSKVGVQAQPKGSTGNYLTTDIGTATLTANQGYGSVSFLWGSIDTYNLVEFLDKTGKVVGSLTGSQVAQAPVNGDWNADRTNRYVTFNADTKSQLINSVRLKSTSIAFETDNFAFFNAGPVAVPEPGVAGLFGAMAAVALLRRRSAIARA
ncbi:PEP-CTERM sorting domain-containing protein [Novosphingobium flavum]|uniref:PEP-CTERM sorting domain-containing protein n=1 Tax=Novosphingobium aerophilum TaxID=2839843 RepID=A0A7X1KBD2_9SPHN|nr:PEP-CTERM sorting domain-containing protein [Novosphingobium aerophilum]MBC2651078.1 PEP-CTERM sorting domain-containing protein [Novosphingobium aerophilum]MBC2662944.1 PEP-CTERM sorting domain-containing protein [Novosphingobium aerophilum]